MSYRKIKKDGTPAKRAGKKSRLTDNFVSRVRELASRGLNQLEIATILGCDPSSMSTWKHKSEKFRKAIEEGLALGIERRLVRIERAAEKGSWGADAWWLERRYPEQWARKDNLRIGDPEGKPLAPAIIAPTIVVVRPEKKAVPELGNGHVDVEEV